jgi:hypothetical protein
MDNVTILKKARALIKKGWCQYSFQRGTLLNRSYCALGALNAVTSFQYDIRDRVTPYLRMALSNTQNFQGDLMDFNDSSTTTKTKVLQLFDAAIKEAEKDQ